MNLLLYREFSDLDVEPSPPAGGMFVAELTSWYSPSEPRQPHLSRGTQVRSLRTKPALHWQPSTQVVGGRWQKMGKRSEHVGGQGGVQSE